MRRQCFAISLAAGLLISPAARAGDGFGLQEVRDEGGGWIVHRLVGAIDILLGCESPSSAESCASVALPGYVPATTLEFLLVQPRSGAAWLAAHRPGMADLLFACHSPFNNPRCSEVTLLRQPPLATFTRVARSHSGGAEGGGGPGSSHPPGGAATGYESGEDGPGGAIWVSAETPLLGALNLYACRGLETTPECVLVAEDILRVDRDGAGFRRLAKVDGGVEVRAVAADSAADEAGFGSGDVISSVEGLPVRTVPELRGALTQMAAGDTLKIDVVDGDARHLRLRPRLGKGQDEEPESTGSASTEEQEQDQPKAAGSPSTETSTTSKVDDASDQDDGLYDREGAYIDSPDDDIRDGEDDQPAAPRGRASLKRQAADKTASSNFVKRRIDSEGAARVGADLSGLKTLAGFRASMDLVLDGPDAEFLLGLLDLGFAVSFTRGGTMIVKGEETLIETLGPAWDRGVLHFKMVFDGARVSLEVGDRSYDPVAVDVPESGLVGNWLLKLPPEGLNIENFVLVAE